MTLGDAFGSRFEAQTGGERMAVQSHIESLKIRHQELELQLDEMKSMAGINDASISDIKRKKLQIKDRIEQLQHMKELN